MKKQDLIKYAAHLVDVTLNNGHRHTGLMFRLGDGVASLALPPPSGYIDLAISGIQTVRKSVFQGSPRKIPSVLRLFTGADLGLSVHASREQIPMGATLAFVDRKVDECYDDGEVTRHISELGVSFQSALHLDWIGQHRCVSPRPDPGASIDAWAAAVLAWAAKYDVTPAYLIYVLSLNRNGAVNGYGISWMDDE
jgi:hypothetical protein